MNEKIIERLKALAAKKCWEDDEEFLVDDYAAGNMDDAYSGGVTAGQVTLAREILNILNEDN